MERLQRRTFLLGVGVLLASRVRITSAASLPRVVVLSVSAPEDQMQAFEEGLQARGWIHDTTVKLEHRTAGGRSEALVGLAEEAVSLSPDVIVAVGTKAAIAAQQSTSAIPIVAVTGNIESAGLVKNFARPEGNVTGFSFFTENLSTKRLELLLEVNPSLRRLKILVPTGRHPSQVNALSMLNESLKAKGIEGEVVEAEVSELEGTIERIVSSPQEGLLMIPSVRFDTHAREIGGIIAKHRVIAMLPWKEYVEAGGLMSYSPDIVAIWREASTYVDRILRGVSPRDLPVVQPSLFELVVNMRSAQAMGLVIPPTILLRADRIIE